MTTLDLSSTVAAKADQLNADDLIGGPIVVRIERVEVVGGDQPVNVHISGGYKPWKPCKTMRRLLVGAWGTDGAAYIGRWLRLYRDPTVAFGGSEVGGIRIAAMSHISRPYTAKLTTTRGKKGAFTAEVLTPPAGPTNPESNALPPVDRFLAALGKIGLNADDVSAWADAVGMHLGEMGDADLRALYADIKPGGSKRGGLDAFLSGTMTGDEPGEGGK